MGILMEMARMAHNVDNQWIRYSVVFSGFDSLRCNFGFGFKEPGNSIHSTNTLLLSTDGGDAPVTPSLNNMNLVPTSGFVM
jgi:hypothetical protein